jgi:hypothetical protein
MSIVIFTRKVDIMTARFRILIVFILLVGLVLLAGRNVASADPVGGNDQAVQPRDLYSPASAKPDPGTVKPPPGDVTFCEDGNRSVHTSTNPDNSLRWSQR